MQRHPRVAPNESSNQHFSPPSPASTPGSSGLSSIPSDQRRTLYLICLILGLFSAVNLASIGHKVQLNGEKRSFLGSKKSVKGKLESRPSSLKQLEGGDDRITSSEMMEKGDKDQYSNGITMSGAMENGVGYADSESQTNSMMDDKEGGINTDAMGEYQAMNTLANMNGVTNDNPMDSSPETQQSVLYGEAPSMNYMNEPVSTINSAGLGNNMAYPINPKTQMTAEEEHNLMIQELKHQLTLQKFQLQLQEQQSQIESQKGLRVKHEDIQSKMQEQIDILQKQLEEQMAQQIQSQQQMQEALSAQEQAQKEQAEQLQQQQEMAQQELAQQLQLQQEQQQQEMVQQMQQQQLVPENPEQMTMEQAQELQQQQLMSGNPEQMNTEMQQQEMILGNPEQMNMEQQQMQQQQMMPENPEQMTIQMQQQELVLGNPAQMMSEPQQEMIPGNPEQITSEPQQEMIPGNPEQMMMEQQQQMMPGNPEQMTAEQAQQMQQQQLMPENPEQMTVEQAPQMQQQQQQMMSGNLEQMTMDQAPAPVGNSVGGLQLLTGFKDSWEDYNKDDLPVFWHIAKAGGSTIKDIIGMCHRKVMASESGITEGHDEDTEIAIIKLGNTPFVNVDPTKLAGLERAKKMGLGTSGLADTAVTRFIYESDGLFDETHKGRLFSMFRDPIDRAISMFTYLQYADWEPTYNPDLAKMTVEEFAMSGIIENNYMTRTLANKPEGDIDDGDLSVAMAVIHDKFLVGLLSEKEQTMERFEKYFGWRYFVNPTNQERCREELLSGGHNANKKKMEKPGPETEAYRLLAHQNKYDIALYEGIVRLFEQQQQLFTNIPDDYRLFNATCCKCEPKPC